MDQLEHALAILEGAVAGIHAAPQDSADVWEALRTVHATGARDDSVRTFWAYCASVASPPAAGYMNLTATMNAICRAVKVERTFARLEMAVDTLPKSP